MLVPISSKPVCWCHTSLAQRCWNLHKEWFQVRYHTHSPATTYISACVLDGEKGNSPRHHLPGFNSHVYFPFHTGILALPYRLQAVLLLRVWEMFCFFLFKWEWWLFKFLQYLNCICDAWADALRTQDILDLLVSFSSQNFACPMVEFWDS